MTATDVFIRTLLKSSAIFLGTTLVFLHPPMDITRSPAVVAQKSPRAAAVDGLIHALGDDDVRVRRAAVASLARMNEPRAIPALIAALDDQDPVVRHRAAQAVARLQRGR